MTSKPEPNPSDERLTSDVFISYSRRDEAFARKLRDKLEEHKRTTWIDLENIPLTAKWLEEVYEGIETADTFAFVISPDSVKSDFCRLELAHAVKNKKRIAPIWYRDVAQKDIPSDLSSHQYIWFREKDDFEKTFQKLTKALDTDLKWVRAHTWLLLRARKWDSNGRDGSFLLRGKDLNNAEALPAQEADKVEKNPEFEPRLNPLQKAYIRASRRATTRSRLMVMGTAVFVLTVVSLGIFAWWQRNQATTRELAGQALLMSDLGGDSLQSSVLLAAEAKNNNLAGGATSMQANAVLREGVGLLARPLARLAHETRVYAVAYSPDGKYLASAGDDDARLWNLPSDKGRTLEHDLGVSEVLFSPDGKYVATATPTSEDGKIPATAHVWEVESGEEIATFEHDGADEYVYKQPSLAFSPDSKLLATTDGDTKSAYVWDIADDKQRSRLELDGPGSLVAFGPDGKRLATSSLAPDGASNVAQVWKLDDTRQVARAEHNDFISGLTFSPDGKRLATSSHDRTARVWEIKSGEVVSRVEHEDIVHYVDFSPNGERLATASADHTARVWDVESSEEIALFEHDGTVNELDFSPDGERLATASSDTTGRVWDIGSGQESARMQHLDSVSGVAFGPDGEHVATAGYDNAARVWDVQGGSGLTVSHGDSALYGVNFSPDGRYLATAGYDGTARVWDAASGEEVRRFKHDDVVKGVTFSPNSKYLATASNDTTARVWNIATGEQTARMEHDGALFGGIVFSRDGKYLATASADQTARVWKWGTEEEVARMQHKWGDVYSVSFSPDGEYLATASAADGARLWKVATGEQVARVSDELQIWDVAFSRDGKYLALASKDKKAWLYEVASRERKGAPMLHQGEVSALNFSPDNSRYLATASYDNTARVWSVKSSEEVARLKHDDILHGVAFSPNGRLLATTSSDGTARVQPWRPEHLIEEACSHLTRNLTQEECHPLTKRYVE
jgi:WD40 repeat protein